MDVSTCNRSLLKEWHRQWCNRLCFLIVCLCLVSCGEDDVIQNTGQIEIASPTKEVVYELDYFQATLLLEGTAFDVEDADSWVCCPYQDTVVIYPTIVSFNAALGAKGVTIEKGEAWSVIVPLKYGENNLEIFATDAGGVGWDYHGNWGGDKIKVYVPRPDARLSELMLSTLILDQAFHPDLYLYTATVDNETTSTRITPAAPYPNVSISVNGVIVEPGYASEHIILNEGDNRIIIETQVDRGVGSSEFFAAYILEIFRESN